MTCAWRCSDLDTHSGMFTFLSYRDPNLLKTADVYDGTADFLRKLELDQDALTKARALGWGGVLDCGVLSTGAVHLLPLHPAQLALPPGV